MSRLGCHGEWERDGWDRAEDVKISEDRPQALRGGLLLKEQLHLPWPISCHKNQVKIINDLTQYFLQRNESFALWYPLVNRKSKMQSV